MGKRYNLKSSNEQLFEVKAEEFEHGSTVLYTMSSVSIDVENNLCSIQC